MPPGLQKKIHVIGPKIQITSCYLHIHSTCHVKLGQSLEDKQGHDE